MKRIVLLGATGGCTDILNTIQDASDDGLEIEVIGFLDDKKELWGETVLGVPVLGGFDLLTKMHSECQFVTGIGSPYNHWNRSGIIKNLEIARERFATIRHPTACVSRHAKLGFGVVLHQHAVIGPNVRLGDNVLVLPNAVINHGCVIGDCTIINSGVMISGEVNIGSDSYIGSQASIRQNLVIGDCAMVGMGAVVVKNVDAYTAVAGSPARFLRFNGLRPN